MRFSINRKCRWLEFPVVVPKVTCKNDIAIAIFLYRQMQVIPRINSNDGFAIIKVDFVFFDIIEIAGFHGFGILSAIKGEGDYCRSSMVIVIRVKDDGPLIG